jgi:3-deoxy-7-phosphoheptulonate synthase
MSSQVHVSAGPGPVAERIVTPGQMMRALPLGRHAAKVARGREAVRGVLAGRDDRLLVIAGPCSVHAPAAAAQYARWLAERQAELRDDLLIVMRAYVEKPRTMGGWKGLVYDPALDGSCDMARGLRAARALLVDIAATGVPAATEWVDPRLAPYLSDAVCWSTIGARTCESQVHRHLASGLPMPVGFKNGTDGNVESAVNACLAAGEPQAFLGSCPSTGAPAVIRSAGNPDSCVVLRGGRHGPNYRHADVAATLELLTAAGLPSRLVIDASHGNSGKDHRRQAEVAFTIGAQVAAGNDGIRGVMLETFFKPGRQELGGDPAELVPGMSVTDPCIGMPETERLLADLALAARSRRDARRSRLAG